MYKHITYTNGHAVCYEKERPKCMDGSGMHKHWLSSAVKFPFYPGEEGKLGANEGDDITDRVEIKTVATEDNPTGGKLMAFFKQPFTCDDELLGNQRCSTQCDKCRGESQYQMCKELIDIVDKQDRESYGYASTVSEILTKFRIERVE